MKKNIIGILCAAFGLVLFANVAAAQTVNNPPATPYVPDGTLVGETTKSYTYKTVARDYDGDQVMYTFDWGDGTTSSTGYVASATYASATHRWSGVTPGTIKGFSIRAMATDIHGAESAWSPTIRIYMSEPYVNYEPTIPVVTGPTNGATSGVSGIPYEFTFVASDPNGDTIKYLIAWGDYSTETALFPSGQPVTVSHTWNVPAGKTWNNYVVAVAVDKYHKQCATWSTPIIFKVAGSAIDNNPPVADTTKPTVSITEPASGSSFTAAQSVIIGATASDNVGVSKVEFYVDGVLKFTDTALPYMYSWAITAANNGPHSLTAKAYDAAGNTATSAAVNATVNIPVADTVKPTVSIGSPASGSSYTSAQTVAINATANDNVGVAKVEFYVDGALKFTDNASPYMYSWAITAANNDTHSLTARAYDSAGNNTLSTAVSVTVNIASADTAAPTVSLTAPANNTVYSAAQTVNIAANASDNVGVAKVEFYDNGNLLSSDISSPYSYSWSINSASNGPHILTAKAYDAAGNNTTSGAVSVTVSIAASDTVKPAITLTAPIANAAVSGTVSINASASDNVGVSKVEFYIDNVLKATDTVSAYNYSWNTTAAANGIHSLYAKAYDAAGNSTASATISVTVSNGTAAPGIPTATITSPRAGAAVSGQYVGISVSAKDDKKVTRVEFYVDGAAVGFAAAYPYTYWWNSKAVPNGTHAITAKAYDADGNAGASAPVSVTVNNR